jgi:putative restriction endonuclease
MHSPVTSAQPVPAVSPTLATFERLTCWTRDGKPALHKPLLVLLALARVQRGQRWLTFGEASKTLTTLLARFAPASRSPQPADPYWRLQRDGLWVLPDADVLRTAASKPGDVPTHALRERDAKAGFSDEVFAALSKDPRLIHEAARLLLTRYFPPDTHEAVAAAVGLAR